MQIADKRESRGAWGIQVRALRELRVLVEAEESEGNDASQRDKINLETHYGTCMALHACKIQSKKNADLDFEK
jgi:hypothetical protein